MVSYSDYMVKYLRTFLFLCFKGSMKKKMVHLLTYSFMDRLFRNNKDHLAKKRSVYMFVYGMIIILAYLIGSIPSGLIIGKKFFGVDIRQHGSGNLGGTNTFRVLGIKAGLAVTIADILKGTLAAALPIFFQSEGM